MCRLDRDRRQLSPMPAPMRWSDGKGHIRSPASPSAASGQRQAQLHNRYAQTGPASTSPPLPASPGALRHNMDTTRIRWPSAGARRAQLGRSRPACAGFTSDRAAGRSSNAAVTQFSAPLPTAQVVRIFSPAGDGQKEIRGGGGGEVRGIRTWLRPVARAVRSIH